jgi:hypothetical protein
MPLLSLSTADVKYARVNATADGDNVVLAAVTGKKLVILGYQIQAITTAGVVTIKDSAAGVKATFDLAARQAVSYQGSSEAPAFETPTSEGLLINTQASQDVLGHLTYREV